MFLFITASADTYITNKIIDNNYRATDANVGRAATLDLFKIYGENTLGSTASQNELSRILIKFKFEKIQELMSTSLDLNHSSFEARLQMKDILGSQFSPANFTVILFPLGQAFDEGIGTDLSSFGDLDVANFITASYTSAADVVWNVSGASYAGALGASDIDIAASGNLGDGDGVKNLYVTQAFTDGNEDLDMDITTLVSATVAGGATNYGFRLSFSGSQDDDAKTRFVKRFASRHNSNKELVPRIVVSWDDTVHDHHEQFYFDHTGSIFLSNFHRGQRKNIRSGTYGEEVTGANSLYVKLMSGSFSKIVTASQHQAGTDVDYSEEAYNYITGVYSASFSIQSNDTTTVVESDTLKMFAEKSGSITMDEIWYSLDGKVAYHTGSLKLKMPDRTAYNEISRDLLMKVTNARSKYKRSDIVKFRIFARDKAVDNVAVKAPVRETSIILDEIYYQVREADSKKIRIPFKKSNNGTRVSTDSAGMFFEVRMDSFDIGKTYTFDFLVVDRGIEFTINDENVRFKVES